MSVSMSASVSVSVSVSVFVSVSVSVSVFEQLLNISDSKQLPLTAAAARDLPVNESCHTCEFRAAPRCS